MKFSALTERIADQSADVWEVHYRAMDRLEAGDDIVLLSVGQETDETTPSMIIDAAIASLRAGRHHYTGVAGTDSVRNAIANRHRYVTGQSVTMNNCAVFFGAQNALFAVAQCLLEPGDEVILSEPYYTTYPATVTATGATLVSVPVSAENRFQIDPGDIAAAVTDKTRVIVLNSPNNPTGAIYTRAQFEAVVDICIENDIWLVSDEVYQEIIPQQDRFSPASIARAKDVCVTVCSLSKSHRMTGWRFGWAVGSESLIAHLTNLSLCMAYGLPTFIQDAAVVALEQDFETGALVHQAMAGRRQAFVSILRASERIDIFSAEGGMFVVLDVRNLGISSIQLADDLLEHTGVALLPCDGFGQSGIGLLRASLCASEDKLVVAAGRIVEYVESI
jgi:arginine:pyruvate transaminase